MNPILICAILVSLVVVTTIAGLAWRRAQGRIRATNDPTTISARMLGAEALAPGVTLLQFSSPLCAPCRTTQVVLRSIAAHHDAVEHVEIDLSARPELASQWKITQTPTTFILDRDGVVRARIGGAPRRDAVVAHIDGILVSA